MPLPLSRTVDPAASSPSRFGVDARSADVLPVVDPRASETYDQADAWSEDVVRREFGDPSGLGFAFAEPGEMMRRERQERWPDGSMRSLGLAMAALVVACLAGAVVAAFMAYPLVLEVLR